MKIISREKTDFFPDTEVWLVHSDLVGDTLRVLISAPSAPMPEGSKAGVVFGTDAELSAGSVVSTLRSAGLAGNLPPLWAVNIGHPIGSEPSHLVLRNRELTPTNLKEFDDQAPMLVGLTDVVPSGGGGAFLSFLLDELRPALASEFPIDFDDATLAGSSLGGLFTFYAFLERPEAFRRYLCISPAIWWDDEVLLKRASPGPAEGQKIDAKFYICAGEYESREHIEAQMAEFPKEVLDALPDYLKDLDMCADVEKLAASLANWGNISVKTAILPDETHQSVGGAAFSRGLRWLYNQ